MMLTSSGGHLRAEQCLERLSEVRLQIVVAQLDALEEGLVQ
jgi:hypothetical protein